MSFCAFCGIPTQNRFRTRFRTGFRIGFRTVSHWSEVHGVAHANRPPFTVTWILMDLELRCEISAKLMRNAMRNLVRNRFPCWNATKSHTRTRNRKGMNEKLSLPYSTSLQTPTRAFLQTGVCEKKAVRAYSLEKFSSAHPNPYFNVARMRGRHSCKERLFFARRCTHLAEPTLK